jgi:S1-C subfamily serine protease
LAIAGKAPRWYEFRMRRFLLAMMLAVVGGLARGDGDATVVKTFQGTDANTTTATFTVQDKWELLWFVGPPAGLSIMTPDHQLVAGVHAAMAGSIYVPKGGTYYVQIVRDNPNIQTTWKLAVAEVGAGTHMTGIDPTISNPGEPPYTPPDTVVSAIGASASTIPASSVPATMPPAATPAPAPAAASGAAPAANLNSDQARAVVLIKGDKAEGTGFIIKTPNGPAVITNIHVIADNPNVKITTNTGALVTVLSQKCASDRDLAMLAIQDNGYSALEMAPDISKVVLPGDQVITPGNSEGGEVMLNTTGKVLGVGPERIEIDNPIYHGNSGGPVFHTKSGKVLGVVTEAVQVDLSDDLDKTSFSNRNSAIAGKMRYFALRLDTVTQWVDVDARAFAVETSFLERFEQQSERLDAYLNRSDSNNTNSQASSGQDDAKIYLQDDKIMRADNNYASNASNGDTEQHIEALRNLLFDLQGVADTDVDKIQNMNNFYSFDQERAHDELDYRKALKSELDSIGNNIERLGSLPRSNN